MQRRLATAPYESGQADRTTVNLVIFWICGSPMPLRFCLFSENDRMNVIFDGIIVLYMINFIFCCIARFYVNIRIESQM